MYRFFFVLMVIVGISAHVAAATQWVDYTPEAFSEAQSAGKPIVVDVAADWCPTCRAQEPILNELTAEPSLQDVVFIRVDFDTHRQFLQEHRIPRQSTIVVFRGVSEVDRSIAETDRERLRSFVFEAVGQ